MAGCGAFQSNITFIADGQEVDAGVTNVPLTQLLANDQYLLCLIQAIMSGGGPGTGALVVYGVQLKSNVQIGTPVYYNTATSLYEPAFDDGTVKRNVEALCVNKSSSTIGDLLVAGTAEVNLSVAIGGTPVAGRYFLSTTIVGGLTTTLGGVQVCFLDNNGNVVFEPRIQDPVNKIVQIALATTTDSPVTIVSVANPNGLYGFGSVKNTGMTYPYLITETVTDFYGVTDSEQITMDPGNAHRLKTWRSFSLAQPPFSHYTVTIQSVVSGQETTYLGNFLVNQF